MDLNWKPKNDHVGNVNLEYNTEKYSEIGFSSRRAQTDRGEDLETIYTDEEDEWET